MRFEYVEYVIVFWARSKLSGRCVFGWWTEIVRFVRYSSATHTLCNRRCTVCIRCCNEPGIQRINTEHETDKPYTKRAQDVFSTNRYRMKRSQTVHTTRSLNQYRKQQEKHIEIEEQTRLGHVGRIALLQAQLHLHEAQLMHLKLRGFRRDRNTPFIFLKI